MAAAARAANPSPHIPVLLDAILEACAPIEGVWLDGTFGAGGYARYADCPLDGVVLDLGVSSMQLDQAERGFSFMADGPLDMRMSQEGQSAADIVAHASEAMLADILYHYGEERAARSIARAIVKTRQDAPIETTGALVRIVEAVLPRPKPGQSHPATRTFQALRIAVNDEFGQLVEGLEAAERAVKRFFQARSGKGAGTSRYLPEQAADAPRFEARNKAIPPSPAEIARNPRARSANLRVGRRTSAPAGRVERTRLGLPKLVEV